MFTCAEQDAAVRIVRAHVPVTPAYRWPLLEKVTGTPTWVKHENATPIGAFKVRSGLVYVARLLDAGRPVHGMITATRGNHGQSLAHAGRAHGIPVTVVVPEGERIEIISSSPLSDGRDAFEHWKREHPAASRLRRSSARIGERGAPAGWIEVLRVVTGIAEHATVRGEVHRNDDVPDVAVAVVVGGFD